MQLHTYIYIITQRYMHTHIYNAYKHTSCVSTHVHVYMYVYMHIYNYVCMHLQHPSVFTNPQALISMHSHIHMPVHVYAHACMHAYI